jgi:glutaminyl-peptide cyclotransferase
MRRLGLLILLAFGLAAPASVQAALPVYGVRVVHAYPHDPGAFTEGLFYKDGFLYESTGLEGHSNIRKVALETGKVLQQHDLRPDLFGEGIVPWRGRLIQVTWRTGLGFVYDLATFKTVSTFSYPGEGWALTTDGARLILSDGTPRLRFLDPATLKQTDDLTVTAQGAPVANLNELEWVKGEILANIWLTNKIARIDPTTGNVTGWIDVGLLPEALHKTNPDEIPNGIAYDKAGDRLFITGKDWPHLYEIKLDAEPVR